MIATWIVALTRILKVPRVKQSTESMDKEVLEMIRIYKKKCFNSWMSMQCNVTKENHDYKMERLNERTNFEDAGSQLKDKIWFTSSYPKSI